MAVRSRRARYLVLAVFLVTAFLLYTRSNTSIDDYRSYAEKTYGKAVGGAKEDAGANGVGGGAVIRPSKPEEEDKNAVDEKAAAGPEKQPVTKTTVAEETPAAPERVVDAESTSSSKVLATPSPTPVPQSQRYEAWRAEQGLTYDDEMPIEMGEGRVEVEKPLASTSAIHWEKLPEHFPVTSTIQLPTNEASAIPKVQHKFKASEGKGADDDRLTVIKMAATHAWYGYREKAWGHDEVMPISGSYKNPFNAWGATLVDALDTLYIMGMHAEFEEAVEHVKTIDFTTSPRADIPLFETTIRYLGGLLAAYDVSGGKYKVLLDKAFELGEVLYSAFDTPNRMPVTYYQWKPAFASNPHRSGNRVVLAELGSLSMEFTRLAQLTHEPKFYDAIARITSELEEYQNNTRLPGMWPTYIDASGCGKPAQVQRAHDYDSRNPPKPEAVDSYLVDNQPVQVDVSEEVLRQAEKTLNEKNAAKQAVTVVKGDEYYPPAAQAKKEGGVVGKIAGFGNPIEEGALDDPAAKAEILGTGPKPLPASQGGIVGKVRVEDDSSKKVKRQLEGVTHSETSTEDTTPSSNGSLHSEARHQLPPVPPPNPIGQLPAKTGIDPCVPQGLSSPSKHGQESFTLAGMSDSTYEYLPKMHLLLEGKVEEYRNMYLASADAAIEKLIYRPMIEDEDREILAAGDLSIKPNLTASGPRGPDIETFKPVGSHLVCFAGGMFALGGVIFDRPEDVEIGKKLTDGCIWAYNVTATGIMPEDFFLANCEGDWRKGDPCPWNKTRYYEELDPYRGVRMQVPTVPNSRNMPPQPPPVLTADKVVPDSQLNKRQIDPDAELDSPSKPSSTTTSPTVPNPASLPDLPSRPIYTPPPPLSHEEFVLNKISDERLPPGFTRISSKNYILRPEAIESVFYLWRITGEQYWRDRAWEMFTAVQGHTRTVWGNSAIDDVTRGSPEFKVGISHPRGKH